MYIVTVSPIEIGLREPLTYFSAHILHERDLVYVHIRNKRLVGVVLDCGPVHNKADIKRAPYTLKKIAGKEHILGTVSPGLFKAAQEIAQAYLTLPGSILAAVIPNVPEQLYIDILTREHTSNSKRAIHVHCGTPNERDAAIHSYAESGTPLCIVAPTVERVKALHTLLSDYKPETVVLSGALTESKRKKLIERHVTHNYPRIWIVTPTYAQYALQHSTLCILDDVSSAGWTQLHEPHLSLLAWLHAYLLHANIDTAYVGSTMPLHMWNSLTRAHQTSIARPLTHIHIHEKSLFSDPEVIEKAKETIRSGTSVFILSFRKGLYGRVRCDDCGTVKSCPQCTLPVSLTKYDGARTYTCHHCATRSDVSDICGTCGGWRLRLIRPGTEQIQADAAIPFSGMRILSIDKDIYSTHAKVRNAMMRTEKEPAIIVGTVYALPFLPNIGMVLVPYAHHLLSLPHYTILERTRTLMTQLQDISAGPVYIEDHEQTNGLLTEVISKPYEAFMNEELQMRSLTHFPPFGVIYTITVTGTKSRVERAIHELISFAGDIDYSVLPLFVQKKKAKGGIRIHADDPNTFERVRAYIAGLHPIYRVEVDPFGLI